MPSPKDRNGTVGQLRALVVARRSAIKARTQATNQLRALLVDGDDQLRGQLRPLREAHLAHACAQLGSATGLRLALASLGRRWLALDQEITSLDVAITTTVRRTAPKLLERHSVGVQTAAQLLSPPVTTPTGSTARPPSLPCAVPARSRRPQARGSGTD